MTPLTEDRTCYFFAYGPWRQEAELMESFYQLGLKAFNEDRTMIEAQQANINRSHGDRDAHDRIGQRVVPVQKNDGQVDEG